MAISNDEVRSFTRQFAQLFDDKKALLPGLHDLARQQENAEFQEVLNRVADDVEAGHLLSSAFSLHPEVFDERYILTVRYGEMYGVLEETIQRLI